MLRATEVRILSLKTLTTVLLCSVMSACGNQTPHASKAAPSSESNFASNLEWKQSRPSTQRYAYLEARDFQDPFLMGVSVIATKGFFSSALNMTVPPQKVRLVLAGEDEATKKLRIENARGQAILSFDASSQGTAAEQWEVDFASSGNDVEFRELMDAVGGMFTASSQQGYWQSEGQPIVKNVYQDDDTAVVDLVHTVSQVVAERGEDGKPVVRRRISEQPGEVTMRLWLKRQSSLPQLSGDRTVGMGKEHQIGYFGSVINIKPEGDLMPIQRLPLAPSGPEESVTFFLKDFPAQYVDLGKRAVASWNRAFGYEAIKVAVAPPHVDAGDPRFHVVKWFDDTDATIPWAGVAKMIVDPDSGVVMSGSVYVQGSSLITAYRKIVDYTHLASRAIPPRLSGRLGQADLKSDEGEVPIVPHYTNTDGSFDDYMSGYYYETIVHEVGHALGLRHNFKGSTQLDQDGYIASIMDYLPRAHRHYFRGPGSYDIAAIRWGYFGEEPREAQPYCSDEHLWQRWDCHQSDIGNPVNYVIRGLNDGANMLAERAIAVTHQSQISSLAMLIEHAMKIWKFRDQLDPATRQRVETQLPLAYKHFFGVEPATWLDDEQRGIVTKNLGLLRSLGQIKVSQLKAQGHYSDFE